MCVNDLVRVGAEPLFFLDYMATGKLDENDHYEIVKGIVDGCKIGGFPSLPLMGGETAEMPGMYADGHFDLAGFVMGKVKKTEVIDGSKIIPGATIIGIESSGLHSNGYSLVRKVFFDVLQHDVNDQVPELNQTVADVLLTPTTIYVKPILDLLSIFPGEIVGMAHITGGGMPNKLPKTLPKGLGAEIQLGSWPIHPIFDYIAKNGPVDETVMREIFNMGIGMAVIVNGPQIAPDLIARLNEEHGLNGYVIGKVKFGEGVGYASLNIGF